MAKKVKETQIKRVAIANRGEIARRIIHSLRAKGISTIALYAKNDSQLPFVLEADESFCLEGEGLHETYLNANAVVDAAKAMKADALHPGYGFLSENANFAELVEKNKIIFIGPEPEHIRMMGDKLAARAWVKERGIPLVPGFDFSGEEPKVLLEKVEKIGYPILIKAAAGGGGKGMKIVHKENEFESSYISASREAKKAFGDGRVYIEKYLVKPRHIEVQLLSDQHGNHLHLYNRDCSLQRRYQKIIEEAPAPFLSKTCEKRCFDEALKISQSLNYRGVGTVEFVVSGEDVYFLEMNTRLQVEHPVTEMITGLDLVQLQLDVAGGKQLKLQQKDIETKGHAIEARLYAENPERKFLPATGSIQSMNIAPWQGIRCDMGYETDLEILDCYDPLIGKIIAFGENREEARQRLQHCLMNSHLKGTISNLSWLSTMLGHQDFIGLKYDTQYLDREQHLETKEANSRKVDALMAAAFLFHQKQPGDKPKSNDLVESELWSDGRLSGFRNS